MRADVIVLGAGMVGVSVALHLQQRGRDVVLIDRRGAGEETSYGNAGLIQREAVIPYTFPREFGLILGYAMNNRRDAVYHLSALPRLAPWLYRYWQNAAPERIERTAQALVPLMGQCVAEHDALIAEAGDAAGALVQHRGRIRCLRSEASLRQAVADARRLDNTASITRSSPGRNCASSSRTCRRRSPERSTSGARPPRPIPAC
jgi:D-amino-acid dehydrogenase